MSCGEPEIREPEKGGQENGEKKKEVAEKVPGQFLDPMKVLSAKGAVLRLTLTPKIIIKLQRPTGTRCWRTNYPPSGQNVSPLIFYNTLGDSVFVFRGVVPRLL